MMFWIRRYVPFAVSSLVLLPPPSPRAAPVASERHVLSPPRCPGVG
jgi:hypothetical protein